MMRFDLTLECSPDVGLSPSADGASVASLVEDLLSPLRPNQFISRYWANEALHLRARGARSSLASAIEDEWGSDRAEGTAIRDGVLTGDVSDDNVTRTIRRFDRVNGRVREICTQLREVFTFAVTANAYVSPPNGSPGFGWHEDQHHVLALQTAGAKRWRFIASRTERTLNLQAGDLLYLPPNCPHLATPLKEGSTHVTFAVHPIEWNEILPNRGITGQLPPGILAPHNVAFAVREIARQIGDSALCETNIEHALSVGRKQANFTTLFRQ